MSTPELRDAERQMLMGRIQAHAAQRDRSEPARIRDTREW